MLTLAIYEAPTMCNGCHIPHQASSREYAKQGSEWVSPAQRRWGNGKLNPGLPDG